MKRVDVPEGLLQAPAIGEALTLPDATGHYISNVLRRQPGDRLELFDGRGNQAIIEILELNDDVVVEILEWQEADLRESPLSTVLFQAIPKGKRWKWILEKATELGVDTIVPLHSERTVKKIPEDRLEGRLQRWDKKAASAARQCGRAKVPKIKRPHTPMEAHVEYDCDLHLIAHPAHKAHGVVSTLQQLEDVKRLGIWIGPEGGFSDEEVTNLCAKTDVVAVHLGPRVLRADTAGIVALAIAQATLGDLD